MEQNKKELYMIITIIFDLIENKEKENKQKRNLHEILKKKTKKKN